MNTDLEDILEIVIDEVIEEDKEDFTLLYAVPGIKRRLREELKREVLKNKDKYKKVIREEIIYI